LTAGNIFLPNATWYLTPKRIKKFPIPHESSALPAPFLPVGQFAYKPIISFKFQITSFDVFYSCGVTFQPYFFFLIEGNVICSPTYGDNLDFEKQGFISKLTTSNRIVVFPEAFS
jgi:hypothetical protein